MNTVPSEFLKEFNAGALNFKLFKFESLDSTNVFLKSNQAFFPDFAVILTDNQTAGHGRFDRTWVSMRSKSLTFSIKIPLDSIPGDNWCNVTQLMALSVAMVLDDLQISSKIRWPNDVLVNEAKICGILAELVQDGAAYKLVLGTGLNVNESSIDFSGIDRLATSLFVLTGKEYAADLILEKIIYNFGVLFERMADSGFGSIISSIAERLYKPYSPVKVLSGDIEYVGTIHGLSTQGRILLDTGNGTVEVLSGEITSRV